MAFLFEIMNIEKTLGQIFWEAYQQISNSGLEWEQMEPMVHSWCEYAAKEVEQAVSMQRKVAEFNKAIGHPVPDKPTVPDVAILKNRLNLIHEEFNELIFSMGAVHFFDDDNHGYFNNFPNFPEDFDMPETIDAIADLLYVVLGAATDIGVDIAPFFNEVHRSNMSKIPDGHRSESGKWIKGPNHSPADIKGVFQKQYPDFEI